MVNITVNNKSHSIILKHTYFFFLIQDLLKQNAYPEKNVVIALIVSNGANNLLFSYMYQAILSVLCMLILSLSNSDGK